MHLILIHRHFSPTTSKFDIIPPPDDTCSCSLMQYEMSIFWQNIYIKCTYLGTHPILISIIGGGFWKRFTMLFSSIPPHQGNRKQYHDRAYTLTRAEQNWFYILLTCSMLIRCRMLDHMGTRTWRYYIANIRNSIRHSAALTSRWGNCGKESLDSFPLFPHRCSINAPYVCVFECLVTWFWIYFV